MPKRKLTISVDYATCTSCGTCQAIAPDYFEIRADGKAWPIREVIEGEEVEKALSAVKEAADLCPAVSISYKVEETN